MEKLISRLLSCFHFKRQHTYRGVVYRVGERVIVRTTDADMPLLVGIIERFYDYGGQWLSAGAVIKCNMGTTTVKSGVIVPYTDETFQLANERSFAEQWNLLAPEQARRKERFGHLLSLS